MRIFLSEPMYGLKVQVNTHMAASLRYLRVTYNRTKGWLQVQKNNLFRNILYDIGKIRWSISSRRQFQGFGGK